MGIVATKKTAVWSCVFTQIQGQRVALAAIFALELLSTPLSLLAPLGIKIAIDNIVGSQPLSHFLRVVLPKAAISSSHNLLIAAVVIQIFVVLLIQLQNFCSYVLKTTTGEHLILDFRTKLLRHLQRLPIKYHDVHGTPDSSFRVQDEAPAIKSITVDGALFLLSDIVKLVAIACITLFIDRRLALVALSITPILIIFAVVYQHCVGGRYREVRKMEGSALKIVQEVLSALRVVKAFGQEATEEARFVRRSKQAQRERIRLAYADALFGFAINLTTAIGMALVLFFGIRSVQAGAVSLGSLLMVITYLVQLYAPLQNITYHVASLQSSAASMERASEILKEQPEVDSAEKAIVNGGIWPRAAGIIELENVNFAYSPERPVLQDISLKISAGTRVGLVGRTGAGKTTFVNMLVRFHDPASGRILLDGIDLREYPLQELRKQFAVVLQDPALFSTTIAQNIAYGRPNATKQQIIEAAIAANAHDFIMRLPQGYETEIGERGSLISGGERQRISMARAFLKDAPILILDEPTSALDAKTEADILEAMNRLMADRTTFFISHRLNTLSNCEILLKLDQSVAIEIPMPGSLSEIEAFVFGNDHPFTQVAQALLPV